MTTPPVSTINRNKESDRFTNYELSLEGSKAGMAFLFKDYSYEGTQSGLIKGGSRTSAAMLLPLANNLVDSFSINVGQNEIGGIGALGAQAAQSGGIGNIVGEALGATEALGQAVGEAVTGANYDSAVGILSDARGYAGFVGRNLLDALPGGADLNAGFGIGTGTAINPHAALEFKGVQLKTHTFEWTLSPKNVAEQNTIKNMANRMKRASLPSYEKTGSGGGALSRALLKYPDIVEIWFVGVNAEYFYYFKPALIQSVTLNYAPNGVMLNRGGAPSGITLAITVSEAAIHTKEDYEG